MKAELRAIAANEKQRNEVYEIIRLICDQEKLQLEERGDTIVIEVCPQGSILCTQQEDVITLKAHTNHGGPGFHAYCVNLFAWIREECDTACSVSDDCGFLENPDFSRLKYEVFYPWLSDLKRLLLEGALQHQNYYFDTAQYLVLPKEEAMITSCGYLDHHELEEMDAEALAPYFFLWNEEERDARFYKNCALHLLAKEGYGRYARMNEQSEKYAQMIVDYIDIAYSLDPAISLPLQAYQELCEQLGRETTITDGVMMEEEITQYRQHEVYHLFHEWNIYAPGCCERSYDGVHDELYLMAPYEDASCGWEWMWKIASYASQPESWEHLLQGGERWTNDTLTGTYEVERQEDLFLLRALLFGRERLYIEIAVREEADLPYLKACIRRCHDGRKGML